MTNDFESVFLKADRERLPVHVWFVSRKGFRLERFLLKSDVVMCRAIEPGSSYVPHIIGGENDAPLNWVKPRWSRWRGCWVESKPFTSIKRKLVRQFRRLKGVLKTCWRGGDPNG